MKTRKNFSIKKFIYFVCFGFIVGAFLLSPILFNGFWEKQSLTTNQNQSEVFAEGYQISTEEQLKSWLTNVDGVQDQNPNANIMSNITLSWGNNCAPSESNIKTGSLLNGNGYSITLAGVTATIGSERKQSHFSVFSRWLDGTIKNTNFVTGGDFNFTIDNVSAKDNTDLATGLIFGQINNGTVSQCNIELNHNLKYDTPEVALGGGSGNHFGVISGTILGSSIIEYTKVRQSENSTVSIFIERGWCANYIRASMICADAYKTDGNIPLIKNIEIDRNGKFVFSQATTNTSQNSMIFGNVVADMQAGGTGGDHGVTVDGVIYKGLGGATNNGISFLKQADRGTVQGYLLGRRGDYDIYKNFYSYVNLTDEASLREDGGVTYIPNDCSLKFDPENENNVILTANNLTEEGFIWDITYEKVNQKEDVYTQLSKGIKISKHNAESSLPIETINLNYGTIKNNVLFGFETDEATYNGREHFARFDINGEIIKEGFEAEYLDNKDAVTTTGKNAVVTLNHSDRRDGIYLKEKKYFIYDKDIINQYTQMKINPAPLSLNYTEGDIYTNLLTISGLVGGENLTIEGTAYSNESVRLDCLNNSTRKQINFGEGVKQTNYNITKQNIAEDFSFTVSPHEIIVDEGILVTGVEDKLASFREGKLFIYSKNYYAIQLQFEQSEGYLNKAELISKNNKDYEILADYSKEGIINYNIQQKNENDFQYLSNISLKKSLKKVAVKFEVTDSSKLSEFLVDEKDVFEFGDYYVSSFNYGEEFVLKLSLSQEFAENYQISVWVNNEKTEIGENGYSLIAKGDEYNIMNVKIEITQKV